MPSRDHYLRTRNSSNGVRPLWDWMTLGSTCGDSHEVAIRYVCFQDAYTLTGHPAGSDEQQFDLGGVEARYNKGRFQIDFVESMAQHRGRMWDGRRGLFSLNREISKDTTRSNRQSNSLGRGSRTPMTIRDRLMCTTYGIHAYDQN